MMTATKLTADPTQGYGAADFLDCMEGLELPTAQKPPETRRGMLQGVALCGGLTVIALGLNQLSVWPFQLASGRHPLEPVMLAIIMGIVLGNIGLRLQPLQVGIKWVARRALPLGIILLGARLNFLDVLRVGLGGILMTLVEMALALVIMIFLARRMGLSTKLATLIGVGTAICGGTAIVATAPVIDADENDVVFSVATVTLLGLVAMALLPLIGGMLEMSQQAFGIWAGLSIHQTPQVIASGFAYGDQAGETATVVKLARVCLLAPVVFMVGYWYARRRAGAGATKVRYRNLFPLFILGFLGMALARSLGLLPSLSLELAPGSILGARDWNFSVPYAAQRISEICIVASMAAVGLETRFKALKRTGYKPFVAGLIASVVICAALLVMIRLTTP
jgi:uncharacterized integral membrane protein (TIGR00698 family)